MKRITFESLLTAATLAAFLCVMAVSWAIARDLPDRKAVQIEAQQEYRAELAAASLCAAEGKTAVWNDRQEIECLKESP